MSSNESIDQGGSIAVYKRTDARVFCLREDEFGRGLSPGLPTDREVGIGTGV